MPKAQTIAKHTQYYVIDEVHRYLGRKVEYGSLDKEQEFSFYGSLCAWSARQPANLADSGR